MECHSHSTLILDSRSWTSHPQQCHWMSLHNILLQQLSTTTPETARRNTIQSLHDHIKWHIWNRTCTRRQRLWKQKQELKYPHSSQKSIVDIPHFYKWKSVFRSYHTTHHSWTTLRTLPTNIQKTQPSMPPFGVYQLWQWKLCKDQWSTFMTSQYTRWQPAPGKSRTTFTTSWPHGLPPHIYTKYRWLLPGCYNRRRFSYSSTKQWNLIRRTSSI